MTDALHALCLADAVWAERYEGWTELGHGGSATLVRTRCRPTDDEVALKVFHRLDEDDRRRFREEVRNAQRLSSPYVVRTFSPFLRGSLAWIEMEWVDGPDLRQELKRRAAESRPFALDEALEIALAVSRALQLSHQAGVIHRDVKPGNVLLPGSRQPVAKLGDFGISRVAEAARVTATGLLTGTPQFAAPELAAGGKADARSDIYSLGLTLYLLFSGGRFPYQVGDGESPAQWLRVHLEATPKALSTLRSDVPPAVESILTRALAKDPGRRPPAGELAAVLESVMREGLGTGELPGSRRGMGLAASALGLFVLGGLAGALWMRGQKEPAGVSQALPAIDSGSPGPPESEPSPLGPPPLVPSEAPAATAGPLDAQLVGDVLRIANTGSDAFSGLDLELGGGGATHRLSLPGGLAPGEEVFLAVAGAQPPPAPRWRPSRLSTTVAGRQGRQVLRLRLD
jgi:hypothetical protein